MQLNDSEFSGMNTGIRRFFQRRLELENQFGMAGFSLVRRIGIPGFWSYCVKKELS